MKIMAKNTPYDWAARELTTPLWFFTAYEPTASAGGTITLPLASNSPTAPATVNAVDGGSVRGLLDTDPGWFTHGLNNGTTYPGYDNFVWTPDTDTALLEAMDLLLHRRKIVISMRLKGTDNLSSSPFESIYLSAGAIGMLDRVGWELFLNTSGVMAFRLDRGVAATPNQTLGVTAETANEWRLTVIIDVLGNSFTAIKDSDAPVVTPWDFDARPFWITTSGDNPIPNHFQEQGVTCTLGARNEGQAAGARTIQADTGASGKAADILIMDITGQTVDPAALQAALLASKHGTLSRELSSVVA